CPASGSTTSNFELFIPEAEVNAAVDRLAGELRTKYLGSSAHSTWGC
ncbi:MAG: hypothetical protein IPF64_18105, partial [Flavobacteriales bacterium]|nr:hypothetical protein [Flavobacteriales bacterium]